MPAYTVRKLPVRKALLVLFKWNILPKLHVVDRYLETLRAFDLRDDDYGLDYIIPSRAVVSVDSLPSAFAQGYVAYALGGAWGTKRLPLQQMIILCEAINGPIVLLGDAQDAVRATALCAFFDAQDLRRSTALGKRTVLWNACGRYTLDQAASVMEQARYVVSHDTGLMHIAAALQCPIVSIWGNTVPALGMYPYRTRFVVLENNRLWCRPCSKIGFDACPLGHFRCMKGLSFEAFSALPWADNSSNSGSI